ncbi:hypothetical protein [Piscibacillus salipiscarius]|uniref:Transposase n=1 Tax=Piscibacillus salipiscarius TaxID=299480 RepID=A0ABW5Q7A9_9BACI|nr:hypothetical protein [Piscibacillus salipiscarius]
MKTRETAIPDVYVWIAQSSKNPGIQFKRYVAAYVRHNFPGYRLKRIEKMTAILERTGDDHELP